MFDLSLGEVILVIVVAVVFIGPKELPTVLRAMARAMHSIRSLMNEIRGAFDDLAQESGLKETAQGIEREVRMIKGDDGQMYESYDTSDLMIDLPKKPTTDKDKNNGE
jgi:Tat protein translocase TatB subunit